MIFVNAETNSKIHIGRAGEHKTTTVVFDVSDWVEEVRNEIDPDLGTIQLIVEQNSMSYPQLVEYNREEKKVYWVVTHSNTSEPGIGKCELFYLGKEELTRLFKKPDNWETEYTEYYDAEGNKLVEGAPHEWDNEWKSYSDDIPYFYMARPTLKTALYEIIVTNALGYNEEEPPGPYESWFNNVLDASADAKQAALNAKADADRAASLAKEVSVNAVQAAQDASKAAKAKEAAQTAQRLAEEARGAAEAAGTAASASASAASESASAAKASEDNAAQSATDAQSAMTTAQTAQSSAEAAQSAAAQSAQEAHTTLQNAKNEIATEKSIAIQSIENKGAQTLDSIPDDYTLLESRVDTNERLDESSDRSLDALWKLNQGISYQFDTDDTAAYHKTVPIGAKLASVKSIGGKTVVWNQLTTCEDITITAGSISDKKVFSGEFLVNHIYLVSVYQSATLTSNTRNTFYIGGSGVTTKYESSSTNYNLSKGIHAWIFDIPSDGYNSLVFWANAFSTECLMSNFLLFDLTQMFGSGNEPTSTDDPRIAWAYQYAAAHPGYNAGELVSADVESVAERGENLLDVEYKKDNSEHCTMYQGTGLMLSPGVYTLSYFENGTLKVVSGLYVRDVKDGLALSSAYGLSSLTFTIDTYKKVYFDAYGASGTAFILTENYDARSMQLVLGNAATGYDPYPLSTYSVPAAVRAMPGYGWSAGDVYNSIERTETGWRYVQRVGSRDYQDGDTVTDGVTTYYVLDNPIITDITNLMDGVLDAITVETGGTLTFENAAKLDMPNSVEYSISIQDDFAEMKETLNSIMPDDTAVNGKPWTSKKIVDSLCQPIEETGNPVQCYPVENYPLSVKVSWEPVQEGEGDPSPDNIRPISGRDSVKVNRCGKNILRRNINIKETTINGITFMPAEDGSIVVNGTATGRVYYQAMINLNTSLKPNADYCLSGCPKSGSNETYYLSALVNNVWKTDFGNSVKFRYTDEKTIGTERVEIAIAKGYEANNLIFRPQIELGSTPTAYEPYRGNTYDIALPETVYGGELDMETGVVTVDRGCLVLTGAESYLVHNFGYHVKAQNAKITDAVTQYNTYCTCSHYTATSWADVSRADNRCALFYGASRVIFNTKNTFASVDEFKAYISEQYEAGTPVTVTYTLETPYTIQLTPKQITALSGVNTIYTDANGVIVSGAEDPKHTITELKNAIISLGGNI